MSAKAESPDASPADDRIAPPTDATIDFRALFDAAPGLYLILTPDLMIVAVNDAYARATMRTRADLVGRHLFEAFPDNPDDPAADGVRNLRASLERVLAFKRPDAMAVQKYDIPRPGGDGGFEERYWSPLNTPVIDRAGRVAWIIHRVEDVTDLVRLRREGAERDALSREQQLVVARLRAVNEELAHEVERRERIERQLVQAQKMEAIGNLTGGLAHDFNNLLGVVIGNLEMLKDAEPGVAAIREFSGDALDAALRGAELTRRLLAFARRQPLRPQPVVLNELIASIMKLLTRMLGEKIEVVLNLADDAPVVVVDPVQLDAALTNLATNARDAMPRGGRLTIKTGRAALDADFVAFHPDVAPGDYALVTVADDGVGMAPDVVGRIFEPFYTTKERDKGTGLGLSMVYGFIKQSGGHITVHSEPGAGTVFRLYLPPSIATDVAAPAVRGEAALSGRGEIVLVVEDNAALRRVLVRQLKGFGFGVIEAGSGSEALTLLETRAVDILFTDIVMPGEIDGLDLAKMARARWPIIRTILTSGFADTRSSEEVAALNIPLLGKPSRREELVRVLREVLGLA